MPPDRSRSQLASGLIHIGGFFDIEIIVDSRSFGVQNGQQN